MTAIMKYDELANLADDPREMFQEVAQALVAAGELHRLFDLRLLQERHRHGLPLDRRTPIDDVEEPLRSQVEAGYLAACREVGELFLESGRLREAWMYLRPAGDKFSIRHRLAAVVLDDDRADELIELALFEGIDPERGYAWLLGRNGTCNSITTLDGMSQQLDAADVRACAGVLLRHVYRELHGNLRGHYHKLKGTAPPNTLSVGQLIEQTPELLAGGNYHLDVSHLQSTVRYARLLTDPTLVTKAFEIADYGSRLPADLQYPGEAPFEDLFAAHRRWFGAILGRDAEEAIRYFGDKARAGGDDPRNSAAVETLLTLLLRLNRPDDALAAYGELVTKERELSPSAPTLLELARASGGWEQYESICRERDDLLGFAAGLLARKSS
jgi:tetratricopeptide (TPR) repeat protein